MNKKKLLNIISRCLIITLFLAFSVIAFSSCKKEKQPITNYNPSIIINTDLIEINIGDELSVEAELHDAPESGKITFSSSDDTIVKISNLGVLTPISAGIAQIIVSYSEDSEISEKITIYVSDKNAGIYPIIFDLNGGVYDGILPISYSVFEGIEQLPTPSLSGYKFIGWNCNGKTITSIGNNYNGILYLKAEYTLYPTELYIEDISEDIWVGKMFSLTIHEDQKNGNYVFTTSDDSIATIDSSGNVTPKSVGKVTLSVTSTTNPSTTASTTIFVYGIPEKLTLKSKTQSVFLGRTIRLTINSLPSKSYSKVYWTSNDESILTINENGTITPVSIGKTTVRATSTINENVYAEFDIEVLQPATDIEIQTPEKTSLYIGESLQLFAKVYPQSISQDVTWYVSDSQIATIDQSGILKVLNRGSVTITASSKVTGDVTTQIKITCLHQLLEEENADIKYILCAPGTDASSMISINYHAKNTKSYIEYTLASDVNFENKLIYNPSGVYFEETDENLANPFEARNIFSAEITNLISDTDYIFRINDGNNNYSDIYHFTTASKNDSDFSFVWLTDNHYNTIYAGAETSEETIKQAMNLRNNQIKFVLDTGDMIDTGGNSKIWDLMFSQRETLKQLPLLSTTGNHELYVNGTGQWDNRFQAAYNALPKNSVEGKLGTSCYFYYNDVLFIIFEDVSSSSYDLQLEWMENLLKEAKEENKAKLIIAACHAPIQSEDPSNSKNDRDTTIMNLFDKYGVDLVLTGHYHSHEVVRNYYNGERSGNSLLGVNYMRGNPAGAKGAGTTDLKEYAKGYIVDIVGTSIVVTQINANGVVLSKDTFNSIKYEEMSEEAKKVSKEEIINSLSIIYNSDKTCLNFNWSEYAYGNVEKITFNETHRSEIFKEFYCLSPAYTFTTIDKIYAPYDYNFEITFYFKDGTIISKTINYQLSNDLNIHINNYDPTHSKLELGFNEANSSIKFQIKSYQIYVDNVLIDTVNYLNNSVPLTTYALDNIKLDNPINIKIVAINKQGKIIFTSEKKLTPPN